MHCFRADDFHFTISSSHAHLVARASDLLHGVGPGVIEQAIDIELDTDGELFFLRSERSMETSASESALFASLVTLLNRKSLDASPDSLHLHAGTVAREGRAILIVAPSGSGKTTTTAALAARGWDYLSDETAQVIGRQLQTWPKPLSVKRSGFDTMQQLLGDRIDLDGDQSSWIIPVSNVGFSIARESTAQTIVFLDPDASPTPSPMSPADATVALVEQTMDFERVGPEALETLAGLAAGCHLFTIGRTDPADMAEIIEAEAASGIRRSEHPNDVETLTIPWVSDVSLVRIGADLVIRNGTSGAVASLNAVGADAVARMSAAPDAGSIETKDAAFLEQLQQADLLPTSLTSGQLG